MAMFSRMRSDVLKALQLGTPAEIVFDPIQLDDSLLDILYNTFGIDKKCGGGKTEFVESSNFTTWVHQKRAAQPMFAGKLLDERNCFFFINV